MNISRKVKDLNTTVRGRVLLGLMANFVGKVWIIIVQLVSVPVLTSEWGAYGYGLWLMITTVPGYMALSSIGFGEAAAIDMTQKFARGDRAGALAAFQSVWLLLSTVLLAIFVCSLAVWWVGLPLFRKFGLSVEGQEVITPVIILVVYSIGIVQMSIISVGFQSTRRYAQGTLLMDMLVPLEALSVVIVSLTGHGFISAALAMMTIRMIGVLAYYLLLIRFEPWLALGWSHASFNEIKRLSSPAIALLSMTVSSAFSLQGVILSIGFVESPTAAAVFATARLLTRTPLQFIGLVNRATLPEMTAAYSQENPVLSARLFILNFGVTALVAIPSAIALVLVGPWATGILSRGQLHASAQLLLWLAITAAVQAAWATVAQFLYAINKQQTFAYQYLGLAALTAGVPWLLGKSGMVETVAAFWCIAETCMLIVVYRAWWRESDVHFVHLTEAVYTFAAALGWGETKAK